MIYDGWNPAVHLVDRFAVPKGWPRYWVVDFGYTHPFVWQCWAEDPDGRLWLVWEIYRTQRLVEDHAADIRAWVEAHDEPPPQAVICDHDAEGRATLERHLGYPTTASHKAVSEGIQAVQSRLRVAGDGRPRIFFLRDALIEPDAELRDERRLPAATVEEFDSYVWNTKAGRNRGEEPVKEFDHGLDTSRYMVAYRDLVGEVSYLPSLYT